MVISPMAPAGTSGSHAEMLKKEGMADKNPEPPDGQADVHEFITQILAEDDYSLDVLVFSQKIVAPLTDHKISALAVGDPEFMDYHNAG